MPQYPQSNGQVKTIFETLLNYLKRQLEWARAKWIGGLPGVLWAQRTTNKRPTRVTPSALAYDMEVFIPTEIGLHTVKTTMQESETNEKNLKMHLD